MRVEFEEMRATLGRVLEGLGFSAERAARFATLFAESSLDGVYTHGLDRFPRFVRYVRDGLVDPGASPVLTAAFPALELWDGRLGPGNLNAEFCMGRAIAIARRSGTGAVALKNTNHWMRGGSYGWQAAEAGCAAIAWTNTMPNMPAWGARSAGLGNNPLVIAVPRKGGHVVLDMAMSQFSYGKLEAYRARGEALPVEGGYDGEGRASKDPGAILEAGRPLPIGYWKGSGLSLLLDLIASALSGGSSVSDIGARGAEFGLSQVFLAFALERLPDPEALLARVEATVAHLREGTPVTEAGADAASGIRYPGERTLKIREENLRLGIPVTESLWQEVLRLATRGP
jgi:3-dehydro-L-gulonate 2-dehydrogenase